MKNENLEKQPHVEEDLVLSIKTVFIGDEAVGKTSIIQRFIYNKFNEKHDSTIGALFFVKKIKIDDIYLKYEIWDTAGQERFHSITANFYKRARASVIVFDLTNKKTFDNMIRWYNELTMNNANCKNIIICGNKSDLTDKRQINLDVLN
jgi:small GTP-binding protein